MYDTDFICTYKLHNKEDQELMYRSQFLQAFGLTQWDDDIVDVKMTNLYNFIKDRSDTREIISKAKTSKDLEIFVALSNNDDAVVFRMLFKFELFDMTHRYLCDAINNNDTKAVVNKEILLKNL